MTGGILEDVVVLYCLFYKYHSYRNNKVIINFEDNIIVLNKKCIFSFRCR